MDIGTSSFLDIRSWRKARQAGALRGERILDSADCWSTINFLGSREALQFHIARYAPVAQLDSACDSDASGQSGCDMAQSPANRGVERAERKNLCSVDYCLTTV